MLHVLRPLPMPVAAFAGPALLPITITSSATFSAAENQTAVATLTASGGTGSYTWTKIGGADTAKFTLTSGGVLTFATAPDFEAPTDANTDNVYLVQVQADDGVSTPATQNISVTVTDVVESIPTTWNPFDTNGTVTLTNGNLTATSGTSDGAVRSFASQTTGKFYFEITWGPFAPTNNDGCGVIKPAPASLSLWRGAAGTGGLLLVCGPTGPIYRNNVNTGVSIGAVSAAGAVVSWAIDLTNMQAWARVNGGNWNGSGTANPATNVGGIDVSAVFTGFGVSAGFTGHVFAGKQATANFGATAFAFAVPSGFNAGPSGINAVTYTALSASRAGIGSAVIVEDHTGKTRII